DGEVVAGEAGHHAVGVDGADADHAGVVRGEGLGCVIRPGRTRRAAGVPGRGDHDHAVVVGLLQLLPDRRARRAVTDRHADDLRAVRHRVTDPVGQRLLDDGLPLTFVLAVVRVTAVRNDPDGQDPGSRRDAGDPVEAAVVPVPRDQRRHPGTVHAPVPAGRAGVDAGVVGTGEDRPGQVADMRIDAAVDDRDGYPGPLGHRPCPRDVEHVQHPLLLVLVTVGDGRAGRSGGQRGQDGHRYQGGHGDQGQPGPVQHPGAPGQRGAGGVAASVCATLRATPAAMLVISPSEYSSRDTGTRGRPSEYPAAYMTTYGPAVKLAEICRL